MSKDQALGAMLLVGGVAGIAVYGWLVFLTSWSLLVLELTGFIAVAGVLGMLVWIGYTLAATPPPKSTGEVGKGLWEQKPRREASAQTAQPAA
ncbi:MAG: transcriptional regulator [Candidatus Bathyarchaeia archaeon]